MYLVVYTKGIYSWNFIVYSMVAQANVKLYESQNRHSIKFPKEFVKDSAFPFKVMEELVARIEGDKIIIERKKE